MIVDLAVAMISSAWVCSVIPEAAAHGSGEPTAERGFARRSQPSRRVAVIFDAIDGRRKLAGRPRIRLRNTNWAEEKSRRASASVSAANTPARS